MIYLRGHPSDYDHWRQIGCVGWAWDDVLAYFKRAEDFHAPGNGALHGFGGPLAVSEQAERNELTEMFIAACQEAGIPFNPDLNGSDIRGCGYFPATIRGNERGSTARAYLTPAMHRPNLKVVTKATVTRLTIERGRVVGADYVHRGKKPSCARRVRNGPLRGRDWIAASAAAVRHRPAGMSASGWS
ncbi:GMC family oxidoreductase N-terminal domain-containing protein [Roseibium salinum]|nr:GMC family oxidoreductase N-terminal domain-containing protein [Roseibium salinum]